VSSTIIK